MHLLQGLTQVEEMLISAVLPIMSLYTIYRMGRTVTSLAYTPSIDQNTCTHFHCGYTINVSKISTTSHLLHVLYAFAQARPTMPCISLVRGQTARRFVLVRYQIGKYVRTHVVRSEGFGDHIAFPSRSFSKSAPVNRSFQVTIWVLIAPNSISEHANFKIFLGGHAPRPTLSILSPR